MVNRIIGLIGWLGAALVFAGAAIRFLYPAREQWVPYFVWAGLACVLIYGAGQWREIVNAFRTRQTRYGALAGASVLIVLGILIAVNYIGARQNKRWDLTANKAFSLSDQSRGVLAKLDAPLQMMLFAQEQDFPRYRDKLQEYQYVSKQITTEYIDPDKKPTIARQNQVQQYGTVVLAYKGRTERVTSDTEQDITNGIIKVVTGQQKKVYFVQGHGERDTTSSERDGYNAIAGALSGENYTVEKLVLAQTGAVPADAAVVVAAGPKTDFFPPEIDALKKYLESAGKLLLLLDPPDMATGPPLTNLIGLAHDWGMDVGNDVVVDASGMGRLLGTDASVPVVATYGSHPITERFSFVTAFPLARSITPVMGGVNGHTAQPFAQTSPQSWSETNIKALLGGDSKVSFSETEGDKRGPITIAAATSAASKAPSAAGANPLDPEAPQPETRVAVVGDSDFAANAGLGIQGNRDLFMNTVGWLSQQENLIAIRPKNPEDRRITLTATQQNNIIWLSLLVIPAGIFGSGVYAWSRRRR
jgi:gliding motility-associatede transport system auxiliary component